MRTCDFRRIVVRPYTRFVTAILAISIGNTRTHIGRFLDGAEELDASEQILNTESELIVERIAHHWENLDDDEGVVAIASVNDAFAKPLEDSASMSLASVVILRLRFRRSSIPKRRLASIVCSVRRRRSIASSKRAL